MDIRLYGQFRDRIDSSVTEEQLNLVVAEIKDLPRNDQDKKPLLEVAQARRSFLNQLMTNKPLLSSRPTRPI